VVREFADVQAFLGHAAITTTSAYLKSTRTRLADALDRLEAARVSFAHGSHTEASGAAESTATPTTAATVNPLH
jgi:hypothetical protein